MATVLSIQSWVASGVVGNGAALFTLQRLGIETWSLNTVALSNHTGYGRWRGGVVPAEDIAELFEGIAELGVLPRCDAVLSGYLGAAGAGPVLLDIVGRVKRANPRAIYCCDPVIGDVATGRYVGAGVPEFYRDHALGLADIATPNRFELEWLTGCPIGTIADAAAAAESLRRQGPGLVLVSSLEPAAGRVAVLAASGEGIWIAETPLLPIEATGCGDALAALFLGRRVKGEPVPEALAHAVAALWGVVDATARAGGGELALITAQDELVAPSRRVQPVRL
ncbi:MAG: pyridoxal kinase PdxY [Stellaceae bacterium]